MTDQNPSADPPPEIGVEGVKELLDQNAEFLLLDCREQDEWATCKIDGATHIPMKEIPERISELAAYRQERIVVYCHGGMRSLQVTNWLRANGFSQSQSMAGGIDDWSQQVDPTVPRY